MYSLQVFELPYDSYPKHTVVPSAVTLTLHPSGEELYPLVAEMDNDNAGKITGMLLEMTEADVISIIEDRQACEEKVSTPFSTLN